MSQETLANEDARQYLCISCDSIVRARWTGSGAFHVGCDCTTAPVVPQMGQAETPDSWMVERPDCCRGVAPTEMEQTYDPDTGEYQCTECNATYNWDGSMETPPPSECSASHSPVNQSLSGFKE